MKNITKRIIAVFAVLAVTAMSFAGCTSKKEETSAPKQYPFKVGEAADGVELTPGNPDADLNADDPIAPDNSGNNEPATEIVEVTEADGQPATQYVQVTEADGQPATDAKGENVTKPVPVTQVVTKPAQSGDNQTATKPVGDGNSDYTSKEDGRYAMWLDISKNENFFFEGDMIKATFKVKEGIPDGDYKIKIAPDLSDIAGVSIHANKVIDGIIRVNNGEISAVDVSGESGLVFYGDMISCKQGDTIDFNINIKNNSGLAAFFIWFYFDSNALEFVEAVPTGEFDEIAQNTEIGGSKK